MHCCLEKDGRSEEEMIVVVYDNEVNLREFCFDLYLVIFDVPNGIGKATSS